MNEDRLYQVLDRIERRLNDIDVTLGAQHAAIDSYSKRTENLENRVTPLERWFWRVTGAIALASTVLTFWKCR